MTPSKYTGNMIKNIIFDFGDIFINLDKPATVRELTNKFGVFEISTEMDTVNKEFEKGILSADQFINFYSKIFHKADKEELIKAWNAMILDFPEYRLKFIERLALEKKYNLFLLSNTNDLHIRYVEMTMLPHRYKRFRNCFQKFYLSHEINFRKPDSNIYEFVLKENKLIPEETLFIDDTEENTFAAKKLGIQVWNLIPGSDDITDLFNQNIQF